MKGTGKITYFYEVEGKRVAVWREHGVLDRRAGSQFPMRLCAQADRLEVFSTWVSTEGCAAQVIMPMNDEDIRSR